MTQNLSKEMTTLAEQLFWKLHEQPEVSGQEVKTGALLQHFLREHTSLELCACKGGFYAAHRETDCTQGAIAIRADYDALALPEGGAAHLCGHDGHSAALCLTAMALEGQRVGRSVFFLFQSAEETGAGAKLCLDFMEKESIQEIYGAHNLPGFPFGQIFTRPGTFACGSLGLTLRFHGKATHAAYPEHGISPATAVGKLLCFLKDLTAPGNFSSMTLCTVIGVSMGEKAFGAAAADADLWLTLRAEEETNLVRLKADILQEAGRLSEEEQLVLTTEEQDVFPATENHRECADKIMDCCGGNMLQVPMRWSEDFGHYLQRCKGAYFGIGAGEKQAALHTSTYCYPEKLLGQTAEAFLKLIGAS